ncbi:MAG: alpha/beta fold hydrolase [Coriobacteriales bacterium]|nr:alpha/beta fold hydrolase [Coriobacteriales bacterium]
MKEFFINADGVKIHAKLQMPDGVARRCPLAIVQHGLTGHMEEDHIVGVAAALQEAGVATLRVEMYGHGQTSGDFSRHTLLKWIDNMLAVIDYVKESKEFDFVSELYLCGHSQGGLLSMLVAALRPNDLAAIIPMSPAVVILDGAREGNLLGATFEPHNVPDRLSLGGDKAHLYLCADYLRIAQHLHIEEAIVGYPGPVLLVHGTADAAVPVRYSIEAAKAYKNARLVLIDNDDHCYRKHLDQACAAVRDFVREL